MGKGQYALFNHFERKIEKEMRADRDERSHLSNLAHKKEAKKLRNYLMPVRDAALIHRYFFYGWIKDYKFNRCLKELEQEFFISEARLLDVISKNNDQLELIHKTPPRIKELKEKYPWLNWDL